MELSVKEKQIRFGSYKQYSGPWFPGSIKFKTPENPDFLEKCLAVTTSTEGGSINAYNGYDSCISSVGLIQYCNKYRLVERMLGACIDYEYENLNHINSFLSLLPTPVQMKKNRIGKWSYFMENVEVSSEPLMRKMFFNGSSGLKGEWNKQDENHAIKVASIFSSMWDINSMVRGQIEFSKKNVTSYVTDTSRRITSGMSEDSYDGAIRAMIVSYSANIPSMAEKCLRRVSSRENWRGLDSREKFTILANEFVLNSGVGIWPERYGKIEKVISLLFDVDIPSLESIYGDGKIDTIEELQDFLLNEGFDIGESGSDGVMGKKTRLALSVFQSSAGLVPDGIPGPKTYQKMNQIMESRKL